MNDLTYAALAHGRCWAVEIEQARAIWMEIQAMDPEAHRAEAAAARAAMTGSSDRPYDVGQDGVAVFQISGVMTKKGSSYGTGCSTVRLRNAIRRAASDKDVKGILIVVDSPGGTCEGTQELADEIKAATAKKKVTVFMDDNCFSAAYWAVCTASRLLINRNGRMGSLSTIAAIVDSSKAYEQNGLEMVVFKTGELKGAGLPGTVLTDAQRAMCQSEVDSFGQSFVNTIASGRKMKREEARALFTGGTFSAQEAVAKRLVDAIGTLDSALADMLSATPTMDDIDEDCEDLDPQASHLPTISAKGGSTGPTGAGNQKLPNLGEGATNPMKEKLVRALTALGLGRMAIAVLGNSSDDPDEMAMTMAKQVGAEVAEQLSNDPLMLACKAGGIQNPSDLAKVLEMRDLGAKSLANLRADAKAQAVRLFGDKANTISAQVDNLSADAVATMRDAWLAEADAKFGIGADGTAAERKTAPGRIATAADVETKDEPKSNWEKLTEAQKAHGLKMGMTTDEKKESFALNVLKGVE